MSRNTREELLKFVVSAEGDDELKKIILDLIKLGDSSEASAGKARDLLAKIEQLGQTSNNLQGFIRLKASLSEFGTQITAANRKVVELENQLAKDPGNAGLARQLERARTTAVELEKEQNRLTAELGRTTLALQKDGVDVHKLGDAYASLQARLAVARGEVAAVGSTTAKAGQQIEASGKGVSTLGVLANGATKALTRVATALAGVGIAATTAAAAATTAFFKGAIDSSLEFDQALTEVQAISGATAEEMVRLKKAAEDGGAATNFSALEAAQGLGELARATGNVDEAIAALNPTLHLAQAGGLSVAEAATIVTTTLTQFGLSAKDAAPLVDLLATEANTTNDNVTNLGNALSYAAPLAKQLGLSSKDTVAIIGALADQGFRGERAGTALRAVFSALIDPSSQFSKALRDLGIDSTNFGEIITQLATKGDKGREAILKLDAAATPAILSLVNTGGAGLAKLNQALDASAGAAAKTADVMGTSLSASVERLQGSFDQTRRDLLEPILAPLVDELNGLAEQLNAFASSQEFAAIKQALTETFQEGAAAAKDLIEHTDFKTVARNIHDFVAEAGEDIHDFRNNLEGVITIVETIGDEISTVFNAAETAIFGAATAVAFAIENLAKGIDLLSTPQRKLLELFGIQDQFGAKLKEVIGGLGAVTDEFKRRTLENVGETIGSVADLVGAAEDGTARTAAGFGKVAAASADAAASAEQLAQASTDAATGLDAQADAAAKAAGATSDAGDASEQSADRIKKAFSDLGVTSKSALDDAAASAQRNFDIILEGFRNGQTAIEDVRVAFTAYAQAALAAAKDSDASARQRIEHELAVKASVLGVSDALKQLGLDGLVAGDRIAQGASQASGLLGEVADNAERAADNTERLASASEDASASLSNVAAEAGDASVALGDVGQGYLDAARGANEFAGTGAFAAVLNNANAIYQDQLKTLNQQLTNLRAQNSQLDANEQRVAQLKKQFSFLGDSQIQALAAEQAKFEENQRKREEAVKRENSLRTQGNQAAAAVPAIPAPATPIGGAVPISGRQEIVVTIQAKTAPAGRGDGLVLTDEDIRRITESVLQQLHFSQSVFTGG